MGEIKFVDKTLRDEVNKNAAEDEKMEYRVAIMEKMLKFTNLQKKEVNLNEIEINCRQMIEQSFQPTSKRVLDLQAKMGDMAKIYNDHTQLIDTVQKGLAEVNGQGKGQTLKSQLDFQVEMIRKHTKTELDLFHIELTKGLTANSERIDMNSKTLELWQEILKDSQKE